MPWNITETSNFMTYHQNDVTKSTLKKRGYSFCLAILLYGSDYGTVVTLKKQ